MKQIRAHVRIILFLFSYLSKSSELVTCVPLIGMKMGRL